MVLLLFWSIFSSHTSPLSPSSLLIRMASFGWSIYHPPPPTSLPLTVLKIRGLPTVLNEVSTLLYYIIYVLNKRVILNNREYLFPRVGRNIYAHISFL